jgi:hypothetical protein
MATLGEMNLEEAAGHAAGNWKRFSCFCWDRLREIDKPDEWAIVYTHNRDSGLLTLSNAAIIANALRPFSETENPDVVFESHSHWAVGHVDGFSIRVYRDGEMINAFRAYHGLMERLDAYPVLDEADYSDREYEAALENIEDAAWRIKSCYGPSHKKCLYGIDKREGRQRHTATSRVEFSFSVVAESSGYEMGHFFPNGPYQLNDGWETEVYEWLEAHHPGAVENKDDRGAYPSERDLQDAITVLGYDRHAG